MHPMPLPLLKMIPLYMQKVSLPFFFLRLGSRFLATGSASFSSTDTDSSVLDSPSVVGGFGASSAAADGSPVDSPSGAAYGSVSVFSRLLSASPSVVAGAAASGSAAEVSGVTSVLDSEEVSAGQMGSYANGVGRT